MNNKEYTKADANRQSTQISTNVLEITCADLFLLNAAKLLYEEMLLLTTCEVPG